MKNFLLLIFILCFQKVCSQQIYENLKTDLQEELNTLVTSYKLPGITFSILFDKEHQINLSSGYQDVENKKMMLPESKMLSGSVGKVFFSAVILNLIDDGKLSLDDFASKYLDDTVWYKTFPNHNEIKIINLLNHTSGLPRHLFQSEFLRDFIKNPLADLSPESSIQSISNKPAAHPVGKGWAYSDTNYILLGLIVEKITKENIYDIVERELISPLGLSLTTPSNKVEIPGLAAGYVGPQNPFQLPKKVIDNQGFLVLNPSFEWTGGGYATNPQDLTKLVKYIHESNYLNDETKSKLKTALHMATGKPYDNGYGLGTFVWSKMNDTRYGHSGFFPGYVSHVEYSKNRQYAIAIQVNDDGAYPYLEQFLYQLEQVVNKHINKIDEASILNNFKKQEDCWNNQNIECYMQIYAKNEPIQIVSRGDVAYGHDNILAYYKKYFPKEKMEQLHFDSISTLRLADNIYFVDGRFNLKFKGREELSKGWFSATLQKVNGTWYMITNHSN